MHLHRTLQQLEAAAAASPLLPSMAFARQLNLERRHDAACYGHGQLSLRYLQGVISGNSEWPDGWLVWRTLCPGLDL